MANSTQLTSWINAQNDPADAEYQLWIKARYLVAQAPAQPTNTITTSGYYHGKVVLNGPKAHRRLGRIANVNDFSVIKGTYAISFTNSVTTSGADPAIGFANFTIMTSAEADEYEKIVLAQIGQRKTHNPQHDGRDEALIQKESNEAVARKHPAEIINEQSKQ